MSLREGGIPSCPHRLRSPCTPDHLLMFEMVTSVCRAGIRGGKCTPTQLYGPRAITYRHPPPAVVCNQLGEYRNGDQLARETGDLRRAGLHSKTFEPNPPFPDGQTERSISRGGGHPTGGGRGREKPGGGPPARRPEHREGARPADPGGGGTHGLVTLPGSQGENPGGMEHIRNPAERIVL